MERKHDTYLNLAGTVDVGDLLCNKPLRHRPITTPKNEEGSTQAEHIWYPPVASNVTDCEIWYPYGWRFGTLTNTLIDSDCHHQEDRPLWQTNMAVDYSHLCDDLARKHCCFCS